jgi:hypothetical protein
MAASSVVFAFDDVVEEHVRGAERDDGLNQERVEARHVEVSDLLCKQWLPI